MISAYRLIGHIAGVLFLVWPGVVLVCRFLWPAKITWWRVSLAILAGSATLFVGSVTLDKTALQWEIENGRQPPPPELVNRLVNDAGDTIALQIWPLYMIIVAGFWFVLYGLAAWLHRAFKKA